MSAKVASGYLVGGLSSSRVDTFQVANEVLRAGSPASSCRSRIEVATRLTQGCSPLRSGPGAIPVRHVVTEGERNLIVGARRSAGARRAAGGHRRSVRRRSRRAAQWDSRRAAGRRARTPATIWCATSWASIRSKKVIAIGALVERRDAGHVLPARRGDRARGSRPDARRDRRSARRPAAGRAVLRLRRARRAHVRTPLGGARDHPRRGLGDFPLAGFFCNGEISHDRLYGYTGVLTLFADRHVDIRPFSQEKAMPKAIRFHKTGGPEVLVWEDVEVGDPGPGPGPHPAHAIGLNFIDTYQRSGLYPMQLPSGTGYGGRGRRRGGRRRASRTSRRATAWPTPAPLGRIRRSAALSRGPAGEDPRGHLATSRRRR